MRVKKLPLAAVALLAGLSLTACGGGSDDNAGGGSDGSAGGGSSSAATGQASVGGASEGGGSATGGAQAAGNSGDSANASSGSGSGSSADADEPEGSGGGRITAGACKTENLAFDTAHGMGEGTLVVSMRNTSGDACSLKGFPGIDILSDEAGAPLSAERSDMTAPAVNLKSGDTTRFTLHYPPSKSGNSGVFINAVDVTPPNETHTQHLSVGFSVEAGADKPGLLVVDPVGAGKQ
ncbi:Protein of unknown function [Streptomyces sp. TverLS-915]|uniref:DUF4232 domain-containing protein n=1 Tax=Streptomyces sp. TverLS-915 TaxID=1839763 RepID=UPI00081F1C81|nr:DUF4232 domain-containing protein [Streptomyces sp. TverLS-915]SCD27830.1 Protein of unknown function [Streptomyces sp. TverLS-915]